MTTKIIIADDEKNIRESAQKILQITFPFVETEITNNFQKLYESYIREPESLIITDILLPDENITGMDFVKMIKKENTEAYICLMSGTVSKEIAMQSGANRFIEKGVSSFGKDLKDTFKDYVYYQGYLSGKKRPYDFATSIR